MIPERTQGIILRVRPLTETSLIIHWLTPDLGRLSTVAKGARRPNSPFRGKLDLYFSAEFSFQRSRHSDLHALREVVLQETHEALRRDLDYLQQAAYCSSLVEQSTESETPLPAVFQLVTGLLSQLSTQAPQPMTIFAFEMKLLQELGMQPDFAEAQLTEGAKKILQNCAQLDWKNLSRLKLSHSQVTEIRHFLHGFLIFHLGKIPKGRSNALADK